MPTIQNAVPAPRGGFVPTREEAEVLAHILLADVGSRWPHVRAAGHVAESITTLFPPTDHKLLVAAATLHDIGYSPAIQRTGFHPLDGALYLSERGYSRRLAALVAHHSHADLMAPDAGIKDLDDRFPRENSLLADALVFADMHASPGGQVIDVEERLGDVERRHPGSNSKARTRMLRAAVARVTRELAESGGWEPAVLPPMDQ